MTEWLQDYAYRVNIGWWVFAFAGIAALIIAVATIKHTSIEGRCYEPGKEFENGIKWRMPDA